MGVQIGSGFGGDINGSSNSGSGELVPMVIVILVVVVIICKVTGIF